MHKGGKKSLSDPKHFRKIKVCALLGQLKQMAVCDLALPILKSLKPQSKFGFTPVLFVKLANISEKGALAIANNQIVLHQFLDATAALDEILHPIILNKMYNGDVTSGSILNCCIGTVPPISNGTAYFRRCYHGRKRK